MFSLILLKCSFKQTKKIEKANIHWKGVEALSLRLGDIISVIWNKVCKFLFDSKRDMTMHKHLFAQSAGAVEHTDYTSAEG